MPDPASWSELIRGEGKNIRRITAQLPGGIIEEKLNYEKRDKIIYIPYIGCYHGFRGSGLQTRLNLSI